MANQKSVLLVDDDVEVCELMTMMLSMNGIEIDVCLSASEAMLIIHEYSMLILDMDLGESLTGLDLARSYKAARPDGLVILVTGNHRNASTSDVDLCILKPISFSKFPSIIKLGLDTGSFQPVARPVADVVSFASL